jgi:adenosine/AMP kinase
MKVTRLFHTATTFAQVNAAVREAQAKRIRGNGKLRDKNLRTLAGRAIERIRATHAVAVQGLPILL